MTIFISYIFLGLSLAAPIGPVNAAQMEKGIKHGFLNAWILGIGSVLADIVYMMTVFLGVGHFIQIPIVKAFLWSFGFFVLIYTGIEGLANAGKIHLSQQRESESLWKSFFTGFLMSISNPLTILFWLGIYGSVLAKTAALYASEDLLIYSSAIILGLVIWDITMALVASSAKKLLSTKTLTLIAVISSISLIGFGLYFGFEAFKILF
ncbi:amino acid transporter [Robertmurraya siralis]|uniref:Amino acid transporter n=1 Tax=Robertmurraya siralis TaxID=77777 RepID=A0A919WFB7_9BACI|nr:LysE family transporter [Robertmurraya siralis]PAE22363.1 amino acid transporter [Bacillus sp. 7504-2]GIN60926.1 amino acid transporter [Robertmurraya siralis]